MRRLRLSLATLAVMGAAFAGAPAQAGEVLAPVDEVASLLTGTFESADQTAGDAGARAERLVVVAVPRSRLALGATVLYVEEAPLATPLRPSRQRFFRVEEDGDKVLLRVFEPKDPIALVGKWSEPADLALFGFNDVRERKGCLVTLRKVEGRWTGGTSGTTCASALQGARYATSELKLSDEEIEAWDRGFDAAGKQVWGARNGSVAFSRRPVPAR